MGEHRDIGEGPARDVEPPDGLSHRAGFGARVGRHYHRDRLRHRATRRDQVWFGREVRVAADEIRGAVEDALVRTPIVGERQATPGEAAPNVLDLGVAPAVDRLLCITDHGDVAEVVGREQADEVELDPVGVLELVDQQVAKTVAAARAKLGHPLE